LHISVKEAIPAEQKLIIPAEQLSLLPLNGEAPIVSTTGQLAEDDLHLLPIPQSQPAKSKLLSVEVLTPEEAAKQEKLLSLVAEPNSAASNLLSVGVLTPEEAAQQGGFAISSSILDIARAAAEEGLEMAEIITLPQPETVAAPLEKHSKTNQKQACITNKTTVNTSEQKPTIASVPISSENIIVEASPIDTTETLTKQHASIPVQVTNITPKKPLAVIRATAHKQTTGKKKTKAKKKKKKR
jgi:hypothetical protein